MVQADDQFSCCWGGWKRGCLELIRRGRVIRKKPGDPRKAEEHTHTQKTSTLCPKKVQQLSQLVGLWELCFSRE